MCKQRRFEDLKLALRNGPKALYASEVITRHLSSSIFADIIFYGDRTSAMVSKYLVWRRRCSEFKFLAS